MLVVTSVIMIAIVRASIRPRVIIRVLTQTARYLTCGLKAAIASRSGR